MRVQKRRRHTSLIAKLVILVLAVYATITLVSLQNQIEAKKEQAATLAQSRASLEEENAQLQAAIDAVGTEEGILDVAREKLGLVTPGEIVFYDADSN